MADPQGQLAPQLKTVGFRVPGWIWCPAGRKRVPRATSRARARERSLGRAVPGNVMGAGNLGQGGTWNRSRGLANLGPRYLPKGP